MRPLWLSETDVEQLLNMGDAIAAEERAFRLLAEGRAQNPPRHRLHNGDLIMRVMSASVDGIGMGFKAYTGIGRGSRFVTLLWESNSGALQAIIESKRLTQIRTGAATGVATKHMANPDASTVGMLGSGWQARTQLEAICQVRPITQARVYSQTTAHREAFAEEMADHLGIEVQAVNNPRGAIGEADVVVAITTASRPLFAADWIRAGTHFNAAGRHVQELDLKMVRRAEVVAVDDRVQAQAEAGDLIASVEQGYLTWESVVDLSQLVSGELPGRTAPSDLTLFVSLGIAIEDLAVAHSVYEAALDAGAGTLLPETALG